MQQRDEKGKSMEAAQKTTVALQQALEEMREKEGKGKGKGKGRRKTDEEGEQEWLSVEEPRD
jgi:hypothetical protein